MPCGMLFCLSELASVSQHPSLSVLNGPWKTWETTCTIHHPSRNCRLAGFLLILLKSIILNDNSSSRIRSNFYKYISKITLASLWVLFDFHVHCSLLPWLGALDVEFHTHVFQPIFYIFNKTDMLPSATSCHLTIAFDRLTKDTDHLRV